MTEIVDPSATRPPPARIAVWTSLALVTWSACAQAVPAPIYDERSEEDEVRVSDGAGGGGASISGGFDHSGSGSAPATGGGSSADGGSGDSGCGTGEHFCAGVCTSNSPGTGCFQSQSCEPCEAPAHATPSCTEAGECDFSCVDGYEEAGGECVCASECCTDSECSGDNVCSFNTCQPPPCYFQDCAVSCLIGLQCGGFCVGTTCTCIPCQ